MPHRRSVPHKPSTGPATPWRPVVLPPEAHRSPGRSRGRGRFKRSVYSVPRLVQTVRLEDQEPFITADGSTIREIAGVPSGNAINQSLAEATVPPGGETIEHFHRVTEEIYHFVSGDGRMRLGAQEAEVHAGDTVVIAPGLTHKLWNTGDEPLVLLCCCAPPYSHEDTILTED
jgi:mannose-6-phosphate isomerase-like protein (cupin superfamily)